MSTEKENEIIGKKVFLFLSVKSMRSVSVALPQVLNYETAFSFSCPKHFVVVEFCVEF